MYLTVEKGRKIFNSYQEHCDHFLKQVKRESYKLQYTRGCAVRSSLPISPGSVPPVKVTGTIPRAYIMHIMKTNGDCQWTRPRALPQIGKSPLVSMENGIARVRLLG